MRGTDKLLQPVDGVPLLRRVAEHALAATSRVIVTLPDLISARAALLSGLDLRLVAVPDAAEGMAASLRRAMAHVPAEAEGLMILPADMPDLTEADLGLVLGAFDAAEGQRIVQGTGADGTPGHPVVFPSDLLPGFADLAGDAGARSILRAHAQRITRIVLPDDHALTDLDTPEAWADWRARNPGA